MNSTTEKERYSRQSRMPGVGAQGQQAIRSGSVLIVGVGGLGSPAALYLAAAGVGRVGLVDPDRVELSNLQRQVLFDTDQIGMPKVEAARKRLEALNPEVEVKAFPVRLDTHNAVRLFSDFDVILDGTDNFQTKFLINDAAAALKKPIVFGTVSQFEGQVAIFWSKHGPCYRCLHPEPPKSAISNCAEAGVFGALAGAIGSLQAMQALRLLLHTAQPQSDRPAIGQLLLMESSRMEVRTLTVPRRQDCVICSQPAENIVLAEVPANACGSQTSTEISAEELKALPADSYLLIDVREPSELRSGKIPGAVNLPVSRLAAEPFPDISANKPVILYCHSGVRSEWALELFRSQGLFSSRHLRGGVLAWQGPFDFNVET